jgi:8-oxo-dGTP diphosphatase
MELVYGTYNPAKYSSMKKMIKNLDIDLIRLSSLKENLTESSECGNNPLSNAEEKAINYYKQLKRPIFSCDSGLYFKEVEDLEQPGVKIRRVNGKRLDDTEMINYYMGMARKYGGKLVAYYKNAICLVIDENNIIRYDGEDLNSEEFYLIDKPHGIIREGFPLDSISVHIRSGKYYYDMGDYYEDEIGVTKGVNNFFKRILEKYEIKD